MGVGGIGMNAVQGARIAGAERIVVLDPVAFKREKAEELRRDPPAATSTRPWKTSSANIPGASMAEAAIITTDVAESAYVAQALSLVGKRGRVVATAIAHPATSPST